ncbi:MAG: DsrE family protein [Hyphomicrobiaceae bacterium]|nr:DsrE family protein [Hyphomicrobiaceae bacterium]
MLKFARITFLATALMLATAASMPAPASAGDSDPLFVNMTTSDAHRAEMAIGFSRKQQERKHPVTVFLNDKGVAVAAKSKAGEFAKHQGMLAQIIKDGGTVIVCPMCMKHYGIAKDDLIDGAQVGNPELTGGLLFKDGTQTLTW